MSHLTITKDNFDQLVTNSDKTVLLDFWAPWCGPCRMVAPILDEIAAERSDIVIGKVNVDDEMELAVRYGIASIPTLIVMKNGMEVEKAVGYRKHFKNKIKPLHRGNAQATVFFNSIFYSSHIFLR